MAPDLPRHYRAALTYHPEIGTFRGGRGAWRVYDCYVDPGFGGDGRIWVAGGPTRLCMDVPHKLRRNTFVNPTTLLKILLEQRRTQAMLAIASRIWEGPCPR